MRISDWSSDVCSSDLQDHGMKDQHEIGQRQKPMRSIEEAVGNALDERDGDQRNHGIKGPLAQTLRRVAETGEQGLDRIACGRLRATRRSFEPAPPHGDRKSVGSGKSVSVRVDLGGGRIIKKKNKEQN